MPEGHEDTELQGEARVPLVRGLSAKLLVLTALFVLLAEVLIFVPSVANFRLRYLEDRLNTAAVAASVFTENNVTAPPQVLPSEVLLAADAMAVVERDGDASRLITITEMPAAIDQIVRLDQSGPVKAIGDAFAELFFGGGMTLRVIGPVGASGKQIELVMGDGKLRAAMFTYARNVAVLSLIISLITAVLVFSAINAIMIRPVRLMTRAMLRFAEAPDDRSRIIVPEARSDELGVAERELAAMQERLHKTLGEQKHLADLGLAVSKINHDMRNILAAAQLMSDRLAAAKDPSVQAFAPKLVRTLDRAVAYTESVLAYGRAQEPPPQRRKLRLRPVVEDVFGLVGDGSGVTLINDVDAGFEIEADSEQMFRVLSNLARNAIQAMTADADRALVRTLTISATMAAGAPKVFVTDTGPGLPKQARENLFSAFRGSARAGGTGLGLAIAQELVRAHGGLLELIESRGGHTVFAFTIPGETVRLEDARAALRRPA